MSAPLGITRGAAIAIDDMLTNCANLKPGQEVLLLAHIDGLYGGDNLVDKEAISWMQAAVQAKGANATILWIDEVAKPHAWRFPPVVKAAAAACDLFINNSFDLSFEELSELKQFLWEKKVLMVRNFAVTAPLLCSAWAQTPHELVSEIRYQSSLPFKAGAAWQLSDENGTELEGKILPASHGGSALFPTYSVRREESGYYRPWPEWVNVPVRLVNTSGTLIFDSMLSWWSRYIGISPYFSKPIRLSVKDDRITGIEGGNEAEALRRFLDSMSERLGRKVYEFNCLHFGVHPQASVSPQQCSNVLYRRLIEHSHTSNIHFHIGALPAAQVYPPAEYPYWMHITGDVRRATFRVNDTLVHDRGRLTALERAPVLAVAAKYPDRPGLSPEPRSY